VLAGKTAIIETILVKGEDMKDTCMRFGYYNLGREGKYLR
jgi:hypothetical protein